MLLTLSQGAIFKGNGYSFKGNGDLYWDGQGANGGTYPDLQPPSISLIISTGVDKPHPFVKFKGYGTFTDFIIKNSPAHAISVGTVCAIPSLDCAVNLNSLPSPVVQLSSAMFWWTTSTVTQTTSVTTPTGSMVRVPPC